jgi:hypothetical protein
MAKERSLVDGLSAWTEAGERLSAIDPVTFSELLALARAYVSLHDRELESAEVFQSRIAQATPGSTKASA